MDDKLCRDFQKSAITAIANLHDRNERIERSVDLFMAEIRYLAQESQAKVIIGAVPMALLQAMEPEEIEEDEGEDEILEIAGPQLDFHDMLKARPMQQYRKPIQLVLPST